MFPSLSAIHLYRGLSPKFGAPEQSCLTNCENDKERQQRVRDIETEKRRYSETETNTDRGETVLDILTD